MNTDLLTFFSRTWTIATGSPEVVARRVAFINSPAGWTPAGAEEIQSMLIEKTQAAVETSAAMLRSIQPVAIGEWISPGFKCLRAANEVLLPLSDRVDANVNRLRAMKLA